MSNSFPILRSDLGSNLALVDDSGTRLSHRDLADRAEHWRERLSGPRGLVAIFARNRAEDVAAMLGAMAAGHPVALFNPDLSSAAKAALCSNFQVEWTIADGNAEAVQEARGGLHPDLFLLLSTSGSTGSAKLVRLSRAAIIANAEAIAAAMSLESDDVASGHLPLHYSYGFSILTSHLIRGGAVRLTEKTFMDRGFWTSFAEDGITHLPGVPYHYQMMERLCLERLKIPNVRLLSQAGGALATSSRKKVHAFMEERGGHFLVMYGQTEAAPRMSTLAHDDFPFAPESVGHALDGGRFLIDDGEVVYEGANVMMGYAESRADLAMGDEFAGRLRTGDLGSIDQYGRLTMTGRAKRTGKVYGLRVNLDELEKMANEITPAAVVQKGEALLVYFVDDAGDASLADTMKRHLLTRVTLPPACLKIIECEAIPNTERGKIDYVALEKFE